MRPKGPEFRTWSRILSKWQNGPQKVRILFERSEFCLLYKLKGPMVLNQDSGSVTLQTSRLNVRPFVRCPRCPPPPFLTRAHNYSPMTQPKHKQANQYTNYLVKKQGWEGTQSQGGTSIWVVPRRKKLIRKIGTGQPSYNTTVQFGC